MNRLRQRLVSLSGDFACCACSACSNGYGDIDPVTVAGRFVAAAISLMGCGLALLGRPPYSACMVVSKRARHVGPYVSVMLFGVSLWILHHVLKGYRYGDVVHDLGTHGEHFYNFQGLRLYKEKFKPEWSPRYLASPGGLALPQVMLNLASLISGSLHGVVSR